MSAERVQTDEAELSESLIEQILNDDDLQDDVNLAVTIGVLPAEFAVKENQPTRLNGDILAEEVAWATLANEADVTENQQGKNKEKDNNEGVIKLERSQLVRHLKPLYIRAHINRRPISRVLIDGGAIMNVMPVGILKKLGKSQKDLKETNMKMTNFIRESTEALGFYIVELTI